MGRGMPIWGGGGFGGGAGLGGCLGLADGVFGGGFGDTHDELGHGAQHRPVPVGGLVRVGGLRGVGWPEYHERNMNIFGRGAQGKCYRTR